MSSTALSLPRSAEAKSGAVDEQQSGIAFARALCAANRAIRLYPSRNRRVTEAVQALEAAGQVLLTGTDEVRLALQDDVLFVNDLRLKPDLGNWGVLANLRQMLSVRDLGALRVSRDVEQGDWVAVLTLLGDTTLRGESLCDEIARRGASRIAADPSASGSIARDPGGSREQARQAYGFAVRAARETMQSVRLGQGLAVRRMKRAVQSLVDQILSDEPAMLGMTTLRDYDEYTFTHSVNVCIFSITLGKRLGLSKPQLAELGVGALLHDIGKLHVPIDVTLKPGALSDEEWAMIRDHPTNGLLELLEPAQNGDVSPRALLIAYEHHMRQDGGGYPLSRRGRAPSLFSRIVAVADSFDAGTTRRSYQQTPPLPSEVLLEMGKPHRGLDPLLVKAFISITGIYPIGSVVILDTYEVGIVAKPGPESALHRPSVYIVFDQWGTPLLPAPLVDLAEQSGTAPSRRTIIKTTDPERFNIRVSDYLAC